MPPSVSHFVFCSSFAFISCVIIGVLLCFMIRLLKGVVEFIDHPYLVVDVGGVGYYVCVPSGVLSLVVSGSAIKLFIYTHVREDLLDLYGFSSAEDLKLFEYLLGVSGIGPKTAIGVFTAGDRDRIIRAVLDDDLSFFSGVPRLGKKNAQKLLIELKGKVEGLGESLGGVRKTVGGGDSEVFTALQSFGFSQREIQDALASLDVAGLSVSEKVRKALKYLGK